MQSQAIACKQKHKLQDAPKVLAPCPLLGNRYGVGIGLYFQIIAWIRWLLFWLAICMVSAIRCPHGPHAVPGSVLNASALCSNQSSTCRDRHLLPLLPQVPYAIVINTARFTTADHRGDGKGPGMSVLPGFSIFQSLTFAVMPDDEVDQGLLSWMNIQLPGFEGVFAMPRKFFLICEWGSVARPGLPAAQ